MRAKTLNSGPPVSKICIPLEHQAFDYEANLIACAGGDHAALRALYERESRWLMGVTIRIVRNPHRAEDVLQDAFLLIWKHASTFNASRGSGRGWIYTVVRHRALQEMRRHTPHDDLTLLEWKDLAEERQTTNGDFAEIGSAELEHCLDQLEPEKRDCIVQAFVEGFTHEQIAHRIDAPLGTVKARIRRGLLSLKNCLS